MAVKIVVGAQWGDEGKGKIVDILSSDAEYVARYQGGANAGHTIKILGKQYYTRKPPVLLVMVWWLIPSHYWKKYIFWKKKISR